MPLRRPVSLRQAFPHAHRNKSAKKAALRPLSFHSSDISSLFDSFLYLISIFYPVSLLSLYLSISLYISISSLLYRFLFPVSFSLLSHFYLTSILLLSHMSGTRSQKGQLLLSVLIGRIQGSIDLTLCQSIREIQFSLIDDDLIIVEGLFSIVARKI